METLSNVQSAVTKAIWGTNESTQEPISGKTGDVSKGQPYDAGNLGQDEQSLAQTPLPTSKEIDFDSKPDTNPSTSAPKDTTFTPKDTTTSTTTTSHSTPSAPSAAPEKTNPSSTLPGDASKAQADTRHPSDPSADHHASAPKQDVDDTTGGLDVGDNPDKLLSGPGPRPLEVVAKEHGGNAGAVATPPKQEVATADPPLETKTERRDSGHGSDDDGKGGRGLKYVKSSGLAAEGGDFDASKPGAGREADRLLEQKGVHRDPAAHGGLVANKGSDGDVAASGLAAGADGEKKEKVSLKTKIKNKLHIGSHSGSGSTEVPA